MSANKVVSCYIYPFYDLAGLDLGESKVGTCPGASTVVSPMLRLV